MVESSCKVKSISIEDMETERVFDNSYELHLLRKKINPHTHTLFFVYKNLKEFCFFEEKKKNIYVNESIDVNEI